MADDFNNNMPQDPFGFFRSLWKPLEQPLSQFFPALNEEELDRKLTELRIVEHWLRTNLNLVQVSLKTLELQKATLQALKAPPESGNSSE